MSSLRLLRTVQPLILNIPGQQAGAGAYSTRYTGPLMSNVVARSTDMMSATSLKHYTIGGYEFLMQNCKIPMTITLNIPS